MVSEPAVPAVDTAAVTRALDQSGYASLGTLLDDATCRALRAGFDESDAFRKTIDMQRYRFGDGCYRYFDYPLPPIVQALRTRLYCALAPLANTWAERLGQDSAFPPTLDAFLAQCHRAGQQQPTPLLLRYTAGGYNRLHQDRYGELFFPLQLVVMLSRPGVDFTGGEWVLTEQRPRTQSRVAVVSPAMGEAIVFAGALRPARGVRGWHRLTLRHGVSEVRSGTRVTLGIIFHDAA